MGPTPALRGGTHSEIVNLIQRPRGDQEERELLFYRFEALERAGSQVRRSRLHLP
jgi:hypothetical protein